MIDCRVLPRLGDKVAVSSGGRRIIVSSAQGLQVLDVQRGMQIASADERADDLLEISANGLYATRAVLDPHRWAHSNDRLELWNIEQDSWRWLGGQLHIGGSVSFRKDDACLSVSAGSRPNVLSLPGGLSLVGDTLIGLSFWTSEGTLVDYSKRRVYGPANPRPATERSEEELALVKAIGQAPSDETPRLILADWLEGHGRDAEAGALRAGARLIALRANHDEWLRTHERALLDDAAEYQNLARSHSADAAFSGECKRAAGAMTIHGCTLASCPKTWDRLDATPSDEARRCKQCNQQVHYAEWQEDVVALARAKLRHVDGGLGVRARLVDQGDANLSSMTEQSGRRFEYLRSGGSVLEDIWKAKLRLGWLLPGGLERQYTAIAVDGTAVATVLPNEIRVYYEV